MNQRLHQAQDSPSKENVGNDFPSSSSDDL
jgi:hypothetical protein